MFAALFYEVLVPVLAPAVLFACACKLRRIYRQQEG